MQFRYNNSQPDATPFSWRAAKTARGGPEREGEGAGECGGKATELVADGKSRGSGWKIASFRVNHGTSETREREEHDE
jgi:hypothetical protein